MYVYFSKRSRVKISLGDLKIPQGLEVILMSPCSQCTGSWTGQQWVQEPETVSPLVPPPSPRIFFFHFLLNCHCEFASGKSTKVLK